MAQTKDDKKESLAVPETINFTTEQRLEFLAHLIVDRILEDKAKGFPLLRSLKKVDL